MCAFQILDVKMHCPGNAVQGSLSRDHWLVGPHHIYMYMYVHFVLYVYVHTACMVLDDGLRVNVTDAILRYFEPGLRNVVVGSISIDGLSGTTDMDCVGESQ